MFYHAILPLLSFAVFYKLFGIVWASGSMCASSIALIIIDRIRRKKVGGPILVGAAISSIIFILSALTANETLIKMKPTIINAAFALIFIVSMLFERNPLKAILGQSLSMHDSAWKVLAKRWIYLFLFLAITNELVWRFCSEELWVGFKVFGLMVINILFIILQMPFIHKNVKRESYHSDLSRY